jgi:hypothetical protein
MAQISNHTMAQNHHTTIYHKSHTTPWYKTLTIEVVQNHVHREIVPLLRIKPDYKFDALTVELSEWTIYGSYSKHPEKDITMT